MPKKKTSHMKKRHRQLAGKALKDVKAVNNCPGCGRPKKAHTLCPYCVAGAFHTQLVLPATDSATEIYESWRARDEEAKETKEMARLVDKTREARVDEQPVGEEKAK